MNLDGMNVLVTGSAKRIGKEIALGLAKEGSNIILHYNQSEAEALRSKEEIESFGVRCCTIKGDIGNNVEAIIQESINKAKRINFLINNASMFPIRRFEEFSINDPNYVFSVNS